MKRFNLLIIFAVLLFMVFISVIGLFMMPAVSPFLSQLSFPGTERTIADSSIGLRLLWKTAVSSPIRNPPLIIGSTVFIGTGGTLIALDSHTGQQLWKSEIACTKPLLLGLKGDTVVFPSRQCQELTASDLRNGNVMWTQAPKTAVPVLIRWVFADEDQVFIVGGARPLFATAYSIVDGKVIWTMRDPLPPAGFQNALLVSQQLYLFISNNLYVIDTRTGTLQRELLDKFPDQPVAILSDQIVSAHAGGLSAQDIKTGEVRWQFDQQCNAKVKWTFNLTVVGDRGYGSGGCEEIVALDLNTGNVLWQSPQKPRPVSNIAVINNNGYVILQDASVLGFDIGSGRKIGILHTNPASLNPFLGEKGLDTDGKFLYAAFGDNSLFSLGP